MTSTPGRLSKSRYCYGLQCTKQLWWRVHEPGAKELVPGRAEKAVLDQGTLVGEVARERFPGGVLIEGGRHDYQAKLDRTRDAIARGAPALFEAAFQADGVYVAVDVLERTGRSWNLVEVKSTTSVKPPHLPDVAVQLHVVRSAGLPVARADLMHLDPACTFPDLSNLFARADVTAEAEALLPGVPGNVRRLAQAIAGPLPDVPVGPHCTDPYDCPFLDRCWPEPPPHHVSTIYRIGARAGALVADGYETIHDLPASVVLNGPASRQVRSVRSGTVVVERGLASALAGIAAPTAFLDFETVNPAIPCWNGCHPYEHVPVQLSCHVRDAAGGLTHHAWLAEGPGDPRPGIADAVVAACAGAATVVAFNAPFERRCLEHLAANVPSRAEALRSVIGRLVDLLPMVRDHVYHPDFGGSFGLKSVAPALVPGLGYGDLEVAEGNLASILLAELLFQGDALSAGERAARRERLLAYCARDTLSTVRVYEALRALA